jgi:sulfur carrier protein
MGETFMITICFNGETIRISQSQSLLELLTETGCKNDYCAVALNRQFIPRIQHAITYLKENDVVEIITPMQGG